MRGRSLLIAALFTAGSFALLAQLPSVDVRVSLRPGEAKATGSQRFWTEAAPGPVQGQHDSFADLAEALSPAVVNVQTERTAESKFGGPEDLFDEFFRRRSPHPKKKRRRFHTESTGSGFVISSDGYVVTNNHVVEKADRIVTVFEDGKELEARVVGMDAKTDLALLKVESDEKLATAPLGDSDRVRVGDWVIAIGNPFGLDHTVTVGILSARGRNINAGPYDDFLQTDASINPGNSGGPLIDTHGRVIGINTAINAAGQGIGFAIPINMVKDLLPQLRESGVVTRGWLGVQIQRVTPALAESFGLEEPRGALVSQVFDESPARKAKLERGDVIVEFAGDEIRNYEDLPRRVAATRPGSRVKLVVMRAGKRKVLEAVVEKMAQENEIELASDPGHGADWGFEARNLTPGVIRQLDLPDDIKGVVIENVAPEGPAARAGLRQGDVILEADHHEISRVDDLERVLEKSKERIVFLVQRGESTLFLAVEKE